MDAEPKVTHGLKFYIPQNPQCPGIMIAEPIICVCEATKRVFRVNNEEITQCQMGPLFDMLIRDGWREVSGYYWHTIGTLVRQFELLALTNQGKP